MSLPYAPSPAGPGFYFFRTAEGAEPTIGEVTIDSHEPGAPLVLFIGDAESYVAEELDGQWAGPIPVP